MILHGWKLCERISESFNNIEARISQEPLVNKWPVPRGDRTSWLCNFFSNLTTIVAHKFWNQSKIMLQMDNKNKRTISGVCVQMNYYFFPLKFPKVQRSLPMSQMNVISCTNPYPQLRSFFELQSSLLNVWDQDDLMHLQSSILRQPDFIKEAICASLTVD